jgi:hypothetical protein
VFRSESTIATNRSESYLKRLCHHFRLKVPAEFDTHHGMVNFAMGNCELWAKPEALVLSVEANDAAALETVKQIVGSHVELFGKRDQLVVEWADC